MVSLHQPVVSTAHAYNTYKLADTQPQVHTPQTNKTTQHTSLLTRYEMMQYFIFKSVEINKKPATEK